MTRPVSLGLCFALLSVAACDDATPVVVVDQSAPRDMAVPLPPDLTMLPGDLGQPPDLLPPSCNDGVKNGTESDVDCGATCGKCGDSKQCNNAGDCLSAVCTGGACAIPSCSDGVKNGPEGDVDCGGSCPKCGSGKMCSSGTDCGSQVCGNGVCVEPSCSDSVKNGNEADIDCGGTCPKCGDGKACNAAIDCASGVCTGNLCAAPSCSDKVKNSDETDADCGGSCPACADGLGCAKPADCSSKVCTGGKCVAPTCTDTVKNGMETDADCGGSCPKCAVGKSCTVAGDCAAGVCAMGQCAAASCSDAAKNGDETDIDCGGSCPECGDGKACAKAVDCASGVCSGGKCSAPTCMDMVKNGMETDLDCGGACTVKCAVGKVCGKGDDCLTAVCVGGKCVGNTSCKSILTDAPGSKSGVYLIDPDGAAGLAPYQVYCDMTTEGGGWVDLVQTYFITGIDIKKVTDLFFLTDGVNGTRIVAGTGTGTQTGSKGFYMNNVDSYTYLHTEGFYFKPVNLKFSQVRIAYRMQGSNEPGRCVNANWIPLNGPGYNGDCDCYLAPCLTGYTCIQGRPTNNRDAPISVTYSNDMIDSSNTLLTWSQSTSTNVSADCARDPEIPTDHPTAWFSRFLFR